MKIYTVIPFFSDGIEIFQNYVKVLMILVKHNYMRGTKLTEKI